VRENDDPWLVLQNSSHAFAEDVTEDAWLLTVALGEVHPQEYVPSLQDDCE
jgi:hypothetical protein